MCANIEHTNKSSHAHYHRKHRKCVHKVSNIPEELNVCTLRLHFKRRYMDTFFLAVPKCQFSVCLTERAIDGAK